MMIKIHPRFLVLAFAGLLASCNTTERTVTAPSVDRIQGRYAQTPQTAGHKERAYLVDAAPVNENGVPLQVFLVSKLIEVSSKEFEKHEVMSDPRFQFRIRQLSQKKGADLMSAPSVVTRAGQRAKVEIIREMPMKGGAYDELVNLGATLDMLPTVLKDGRIHLSGKATIRELDSPAPQFGNNTAFSVQSSDTFFDAIIKDGHTLQIICRDKGTPGQRIIYVQAQLIDPSGQGGKKR